MRVEDALRKIALLRRVSADKGALAAERETAHRLQKVLMERYAIKAQEVPEGPPTTPFRLHWDYWQELLDEFDLKLRHFGGRGSAEVGSNMIAYIRLATNQWWIDEKTPSGWQTTVRDNGLDSLRAYLKEHAPRTYSFSTADRRNR
ncbi:MAG: hypothetical protein WA571_07425 [Candidatus Binatus sp.]|jgi:hypothetical protein|uniref:hypothetical protein n=1 Tax=Candidatus Binatus sp. TaxID=2811406 RepID=UPI003C730F9D